MPADNSTSRREFIRKGAGLAAVSVAAPRLAAAQPTRQPGPNERIHVGLIGCGGQGRSNLQKCAAHPDVVVTGACDVWKERRDAVVAEHGPTCKPYADYREMLQQPDIDAVIIATPPHWHTLMAVEACEAGKDLYIQKNMTLHLAESLAIRNAVKKHDRISQVGTQIHASENYRRVVELIRSGSLGEIGVVRTFNVMNQTPDGVGHDPNTTPPEGLDWDFWCGPAPLCPYNSILARSSYYHRYPSCLAAPSASTPGPRRSSATSRRRAWQSPSTAIRGSSQTSICAPDEILPL